MGKEQEIATKTPPAELPRENVMPIQIALEADLPTSMRPALLLESVLGNRRVIKELVTNGPEKPSILTKAKHATDNLTQEEKLTFLEQTFSISCDPTDDPNLRDAALEVLSIVDFSNIDPQKLTNIYLEQGSDLVEDVDEDSDPYEEIYGFLEIGKIIAPFIPEGKRTKVVLVLNKLASVFKDDDRNYIRREVIKISQKIPFELFNDTEKQVLELANNGLSDQEIQLKLGLLQPEVRRIIQWLHYHALLTPDSRTRGYRQQEAHSIELHNKIKELRNKNLNDQQISKILGISLLDVSNVSRILIKTGDVKKLTRGVKPRKNEKEQEEVEAIIAQEQEKLSRTLKFHKTLSFLRRSRRERAHLKKPDSIPQYLWERNYGILKDYYRTSATQLDIANKYHLSHSSIHEVIHKMMQIYWNNCSAQTQAEYPFEELILKKPAPQKLRERQSALHGGTMLRVRAKLALGKSLPDIVKELGLTSGNITQLRKRLQLLGIEVPYVHTPPEDNRVLETQLRTSSEDSKKQELLNQVRYRFMEKHLRGDNPLLIPLSTAIKQAGFNPSRYNVSYFINPLKDIDFPMGEIEESKGRPKSKLRFMLTCDKERAKALWLGSEDLKRYLKKPTISSDTGSV